jgi:hypothetical protein
VNRARVPSSLRNHLRNQKSDSCPGTLGRRRRLRGSVLRGPMTISCMASNRLRVIYQYRHPEGALR